MKRPSRKKPGPGKASSITPPGRLSESQKMQMEWLEKYPVFQKEDTPTPSSKGPHKRGSRRPHGDKRKGFRPDVPVDGEIDLHEHHLDEAMAAAEIFLEDGKNRGLKTLRIIHGMGGTAPHSIAFRLERNLNSKWRGLIRSHTREPGNSGATLIHLS